MNARRPSRLSILPCFYYFYGQFFYAKETNTNTISHDFLTMERLWELFYVRSTICLVNSMESRPKWSKVKSFILRPLVATSMSIPIFSGSFHVHLNVTITYTIQNVLFNCVYKPSIVQLHKRKSLKPLIFKQATYCLLKTNSRVSHYPPCLHSTLNKNKK